jgi:hypothetical protein
MSHGRGTPDTDGGRSLNGVEIAAARSSRSADPSETKGSRRPLGSQISSSYSEDGRAVYGGKGLTGIRSLHRTHGPGMKDRSTHANLPAGPS